MNTIKGDVLIIGERFFPEEFLINDVVRELISNGIKVTVITQQPSYPFGRIYEGHLNKLISSDTYLGAKIIRTRFISGYNKSVIRKVLNYLIFIFLGVYAVLRKVEKPDKILIYHTGPLTQAIIGVAARWKFKRPLYIWTWDIWPDSVYAYGFKKGKLLSALLNKFVSWVYKKCDKIWISSPGFRDALKEFTNDKPLELIPNWVVPDNDDKIETGIKLYSGINFTFTGNIGKVQNLENVIKGFAGAVAIDPSLYLNLVGDGSALNDLKELVKEQEIPNVIWWGRKPAAYMIDFYKQSDALIISLKSESVWGYYIPSKFQTYLNCGKPILAVMDGTVKSYVDEYELGVSVMPENIKGIKEAFLYLRYNEESKLNRIKVNSKKLIEENFSRDIILAKIVEKLKFE